MNILIVEDERVAARRIKRMITELLKEKVSSIELCETVDEAHDYLDSNLIDLLFLDLNLHGDDGFTVLDKFVQKKYRTIIISANIDRALEAYEHGVLDFLPKPLQLERLDLALKRYENAVSSDNVQNQTLAVKSYGHIELIPVQKILYIKGAGDYAEIYTDNEKTYLHSKSLEALTQLLPREFIRTHKSYIVDKTKIKEFLIHGGGKYECELHSGERIPVSRTRYKTLSQEFNQG